MTAQAQKPDSVFQRNGRVHLYRRGCQFSRVLAFLECGSGENDCSNTAWTVPSQTEDCLATHSIRLFPLHFSSRASPCAIRFRFHSNTGWTVPSQAEDCWLPTPFASFPFTSPPVRRRVPSDSVSTLTLDGLFRVKLKSAGYPLHSPLSPSLLPPCVAVCHLIPFPLYQKYTKQTERTQKTKITIFVPVSNCMCTKTDISTHFPIPFLSVSVALRKVCWGWSAVIPKKSATLNVSATSRGSFWHRRKKPTLLFLASLCSYSKKCGGFFAEIQKFTLCLVFQRFKMLMTFSCKIFMTMDFVYIICERLWGNI